MCKKMKLMNQAERIKIKKINVKIEQKIKEIALKRYGRITNMKRTEREFYESESRSKEENQKREGKNKRERTNPAGT